MVVTPQSMCCFFHHFILIANLYTWSYITIPVACLVLLGMNCISPLSHFCMYVYCNNVFDRIYMCIYIIIVNTVYMLQPQFMFMLSVDMVD